MTFEQKIAEWWEANSKAVKDEIEDRTGSRPTPSNQAAARPVRATLNDLVIDYAVLIFDGEVVGFLALNGAEIKVAYL